MKIEEAIRKLQEQKAEYLDNWVDYSGVAEAYDMAIEALRREISRNPIVNFVADSDGARRLNDGWTEDSYLCPACHAYFGEVYDQGYCCRCGQKIIQKRVRVIAE